MIPTRRLIVLCAVSMTLVLAIGSPAGAHTGFESSDPADGQTIERSVDMVTLVFSGDAEPAGTGFEILRPDGQVVSPIEATSEDGQTWVLRLDPPIQNGTVGVRWKVAAPDAHPIDGAFSFDVSTGPDPADAAGESATTPPLENPDPAPVTGNPDTAELALSETQDLDAFLSDAGGADIAQAQRVASVGRGLSMTGAILGVGALVFAAIVLRGHRRDIRYVLHWVRRAGVLAIAGAIVELIAQMGIQAGGTWINTLSLSTLTSVLWSTFGVAVVLRGIGGFLLTSGTKLSLAGADEVADPVVAVRELVGASIGARAAHGPATAPGAGTPFLHHGDTAWAPTTASGGAFIGAAALVVSHLFDGHTVTKGDRALTALLDVVHVTGAAVWAGGVFMLVAVMLRRRKEAREVRGLQLAVRFSVVAAAALVAVGAAGIALAVIILDSPVELWQTPWGRLLMAKLAIVAVAAAAGGYNHKVLIPQMLAMPTNEIVSERFRSVVAAEACALAAAIAVTAFLVGAAS